MASIRCADCQTYVYKLSTGERETYNAGAKGLLPMRRTGPPPCKLGEKCPKGSPEQEAEYTLTWRNLRMYQAYCEFRAAGADLHDPPDGLRRQLFAAIDAVVRRKERSDLAERLAYAMVGKGE